MTAWEIPPQDAEGHLWDVVVVGTGAGGATAGFNLARLGRSVLFVERGKIVHHDPTVVKGVPFSWTGDSERALNHGWWPGPAYREEDNGVSVPAGLPLGAGAGGSTALFGSVMDRLRPQDFTPRRFFSDVPDASVPETWPVSYEEMLPFYEWAEKLFRVRGTADPLAPASANLLEPPAPSDKEMAVFDALKHAGLNPYRIHSASERVAGCSGCPAMLCPRACRNDAARICLYPALDQYGAKILSSCRAIRFEEKNRIVERVICDLRGRQVALRARVFVLAANAFLTPVLLKSSANERFPDGLANSSGLVGRNLMLHAVNRLFMKVKHRHALDFNMNHGLSLNDFYVYNGTKLGNIHAHPIATRDAIIRFLLQKNIAGLRHLPGPILSALVSTVSLAYRSWIVFAAIVEDLPYPANCVMAKAGSDEEVVYRYRYPDELRRRAQMMCDHFRSVADAVFEVRPLHPVGELVGSHVSGTCRFGDDPHTSVLDRDNRAHDLDNLYVLDASFFPSSGGINPSLTIVANSLRSSEKIARRL
jgi:choline dehydrogenase-like flavoprotein